MSLACNFWFRGVKPFDTEYLDTSGVGTSVPHGDFLLSADFGRMGPHLSLSEGDTTVVVGLFTLVLRLTLTIESGHSVIDGSLQVKFQVLCARPVCATFPGCPACSLRRRLARLRSCPGTVTSTEDGWDERSSIEGDVHFLRRRQDGGGCQTSVSSL